MSGACACDTTVEATITYSCHDCGSACCRGCSIELSGTVYCCLCASEVARTAIN
jgi:hypothetical protein